MRIIALLPISNIRIDRPAIGPQTLDLAIKMQNLHFMRALPPIHVQKSSEGYKICDGRHRLTAAKLNGFKLIKAKYYF